MLVAASDQVSKAALHIEAKVLHKTAKAGEAGAEAEARAFEGSFVIAARVLEMVAALE